MACSQLMDDYELSRFRTKVCRRFALQGCDFQHRCQYSHNPTTKRRCPFLLYVKEPLIVLRYLPILCPDLEYNLTGPKECWDSYGFNSTKCPRGAACHSSHSLEEILYHPLIYKVKQCPMMISTAGGESANRDTCNSRGCQHYYCPFWHTAKERRYVSIDSYFLAPSFNRSAHCEKLIPISGIEVISSSKLLDSCKTLAGESLQQLIIKEKQSAPRVKSPARLIDCQREWLANLVGMYVIPAVPLSGCPVGVNRSEILGNLSADSLDGLNLAQKDTSSFFLESFPGDVLEVLAHSISNDETRQFMFCRSISGISKGLRGWVKGEDLYGIPPLSSFKGRPKKSVVTQQLATVESNGLCNISSEGFNGPFTIGDEPLEEIGSMNRVFADGSGALPVLLKTPFANKIGSVEMQHSNGTTDSSWLSYSRNFDSPDGVSHVQTPILSRTKSSSNEILSNCMDSFLGAQCDWIFPEGFNVPNIESRGSESHAMTSYGPLSPSYPSGMMFNGKLQQTTNSSAHSSGTLEVPEYSCSIPYDVCNSVLSDPTECVSQNHILQNYSGLPLLNVIERGLLALQILESLDLSDKLQTASPVLSGSAVFPHQEFNNTPTSVNRCLSGYSAVDPRTPPVRAFTTKAMDYVPFTSISMASTEDSVPREERPLNNYMTGRNVVASNFW